MTLGAGLGSSSNPVATCNGDTPSADATASAQQPLSAYSRFAQRLRRRYAGGQCNRRDTDHR